MSEECKRREQAIRELSSTRQQFLEKFLSFGSKIGTSNHHNEYRRRNVELSNDRPNGSNFCRNAKILTHPLYMASLSLRRCSEKSTPTSLTSLQPLQMGQVIQDIYSNKVSSKLSLQPFPTGIHTPLGIREFALDNTGALLAIGHQSGHIYLYDMDEINLQVNLQRSIPKSLPVLRPLLTVPTKKSIAKMLWSSRSMDDLMISFQLSPQILLFNVANIDPELPSPVPDCLFVPDGKGNNSCGHPCMILWNKLLKSGTSEEYLLAGSSNGYLRCWKVPKVEERSLNGREIIKCQWNVRNDASRPSDLARPVIGVFLLPEYPLSNTSLPFSSSNSTSMMTRLLAVTDEGLFTIWNILQLQPASFGSIGNEPSLVASFSLSDRLYLTISSRRFITKMECFYSIMGSDSKISNETTSSSTIPNYQKVYQPFEYILQLTDGTIFHYSLQLQQLRGYPYQYHSSEQSQHLQGFTDSLAEISLGNIYKSDRNMNTINNHSTTTTLQKPHHRFSDPITSSSYEELAQSIYQRSGNSIMIGSSFCFLSAPSLSNPFTSSSSSSSPSILVLPSYSYSSTHSEMETNSINGRVLQQISLTSEYSPPERHYSTNFYYQSRNCCYYRNLYTGLIESSLLRVPIISYTLPGYIISAIPGEEEILVSIDLQGYLGNDYISNNCYSRSNDICIEYYDPISIPVDSSFLENNLKLISQEYTVESVRSNYIRLTTSYQGPEIIHGQPKVWIRTNLSVKGWNYDSYYVQEIVEQTTKRLKQMSSSLEDTSRSTIPVTIQNLNLHWPNKKEIDLNADFFSNVPSTICSHTPLSEHLISEERTITSPTSPVVALFHHPFYPLLLMGHLNDTITVCSYSGVYPYSEEEEKSLKTFRKNTVIHYHSISENQEDLPMDSEQVNVIVDQQESTNAVMIPLFENPQVTKEENNNSCCDNLGPNDLVALNTIDIDMIDSEEETRVNSETNLPAVEESITTSVEKSTITSSSVCPTQSFHEKEKDMSIDILKEADLLLASTTKVIREEIVAASPVRVSSYTPAEASTCEIELSSTEIQYSHPSSSSSDMIMDRISQMFGRSSDQIMIQTTGNGKPIKKRVMEIPTTTTIRKTKTASCSTIDQENLSHNRVSITGANNNAEFSLVPNQKKRKVAGSMETKGISSSSKITQFFTRK